MDGKVVSVSRKAAHGFSKDPVSEIKIIAGIGIEGDAHAGLTVKHRYMVKKDPTAPNLCQVHLLQDSLFAELREQGIEIGPGEMGENVTTSGIDLLDQPLGTWLHLGPTAIVQVTGLRTPCVQMNRYRAGLMKACTGRDANGEVVRRAGIMGVAMFAGMVKPGDRIQVERPPEPWYKLGPV